MNEFAKIRFKEWLLFVLACFGILGFIAILVLVFGDTADYFIYLFASWGFFFLMGTVFGLHRAKTMHQEAKKQQQIEEEYKRTYSD